MNQPLADYADFIATLSPEEQEFVNTYQLFSRPGWQVRIPESEHAKASELTLRGIFYVECGSSGGTPLKLK